MCCFAKALNVFLLSQWTFCDNYKNNKKYRAKNCHIFGIILMLTVKECFNYEKKKDLLSDIWNMVQVDVYVNRWRRACYEYNHSSSVHKLNIFQILIIS